LPQRFRVVLALCLSVPTIGRVSIAPDSPSAAVPGSEPVIVARAVAKKFGDFAALQGLDLEVRRGECVGLLGPNGAGKSTFIGCLYGAVLRTGGDLTVFGHDPAQNPRKIKERLGVVPQENALDEGLTVMENMRLYARFEGVEKKAALPRINELLAHMSLDHKKEAPIKTLSGGMKRRLAFVRALLSDPELLILDEPTTGLDPAVRHLIWEKVISYRQAGKTVMVTTHYMHEAEILCDRIIILNRGAVVGAGAPRALIDKETPGFVATFAHDFDARIKAELQPSWELFHQGRQCCVRAPKIDDLLALQQTLGTTALQLRPSNLEDVYLKLTGRELDDND
jgi:lipooligosaccharide transport system ATP-binding protein